MEITEIAIRKHCHIYPKIEITRKFFEKKRRRDHSNITTTTENYHIHRKIIEITFHCQKLLRITKITGNFNTFPKSLDFYRYRNCNWQYLKITRTISNYPK